MYYILCDPGGAIIKPRWTITGLLRRPLVVCTLSHDKEPKFLPDACRQSHDGGHSGRKRTLQWARCRLKSPTSRLFTQPFIQGEIKETSKLRVTGLCEENSPVTGEFPAQRASNAENASIWWRHYGIQHSTLQQKIFQLSHLNKCPCCPVICTCQSVIIK